MPKYKLSTGLEGFKEATKFIENLPGYLTPIFQESENDKHKNHNLTSESVSSIQWLAKNIQAPPPLCVYLSSL